MAAITVDFQNCIIFTLLCIFSLFSYSFFFKKKKESRVNLGLPPSPPSLPIIGHLHLLLSVLSHQAFQKISTKYGPLLHLRIFSFPIVLVSSASMAYEIYKTHDVNVSSRGIVALDESLVFGPSGFLTAPYGDYWKFMKKLVVMKVFRPHAIEQSRGVRVEEVERFYFYLLEKARKKESVDIGEEAMKFSNNMTCMMIMGRRCSEENGEAERGRELVHKSAALTKKIIFACLFRRPLEKLGISPFKKEIMGVSHRFDELVERILVEHDEKVVDKDQDKDMIHVLLEAYRDEKAEYKITRDQIKSFFVELFLGGTDTAAQTTQWIMAEIVNNPKILERLREEIDLVIGKSRLIQETDLPNLPYLKAVVKEGLRLHPPAPLVVRRFQETCEIKGFYVPAKTRLVVNVYAVMRDPDSWENPEVFQPERFLAFSGAGTEEQSLKYLPFGAGRRGCPGANLGYIFLEIAIGMMVQCFDWRVQGDGKVSMEEAVTGTSLTMAHPLKCVPVSRLSPF